MRKFDKQPLIKGHPHAIVEKVGYLKIISRKGKEVKGIFSEADIMLTIGEQFNNTQKSGYGLNHVFYKHFGEIPHIFHVEDKKNTIVNFIKSFLSEKMIQVFYEEDNRPIMFKTALGCMVLKYEREKDYYTVITFSKRILPKGNHIGYLKNEQTDTIIKVQ